MILRLYVIICILYAAIHVLQRLPLPKVSSAIMNNFESEAFFPNIPNYVIVICTYPQKFSG